LIVEGLEKTKIISWKKVNPSFEEGFNQFRQFVGCFGFSFQLDAFTFCFHRNGISNGHSVRMKKKKLTDTDFNWFFLGLTGFQLVQKLYWTVLKDNGFLVFSFGIGLGLMS
jgi:hypothetical protein